MQVVFIFNSQCIYKIVLKKAFVYHVSYLLRKKKVVQLNKLVLQYAVLYEARANTGVDRMKIIDAVAKSVPEPHKVDLKNSDKNIVVQIARVNNLFVL